MQVSKHSNRPKYRLGMVEKNVAVNKEMYQWLIGKVIYLSHTRPDITYAISVIIQFMHNLKEVCLQATHRVLGYLKRILKKLLNILFERNEGARGIYECR